MKHIIREARPEDLPVIMALYNQLNTRDHATSSQDRVHEVFARVLETPGMHLFLLELDGAVRATCYLNIIDNLTYGASPYALIENVVTEPAWRHRGLAKAVLAHAVSFAWSAGCYKVGLMTGRAENVAFYEACGFDANGKHAMIIRRP